MVSTVNPKANATPNSPMPTCGKAAASTALPHPPSTSQNVPTNSAATRFERGMRFSCLVFNPSAALVRHSASASRNHLGFTSHRDSPDGILHPIDDVLHLLLVIPESRV